ncbi:MAG TPA: hypothetical protein VFB34_14240 [Chloroflexota bacterium]|nr:hypothetical protein [Chloroflexota bacterium]
MTAATQKAQDGPSIGSDGRVHSVQCLDGPVTAMPQSVVEMERMAEGYFSYVGRRLFHVVRARPEGSRISFRLFPLTLLEFERSRIEVTPDEAFITYLIEGGLLSAAADPAGSLTISVTPRSEETVRLCLEVSGYRPRLTEPMSGILYSRLQLPIHVWLGEGFVRWASAHEWGFGQRQE